MPICDIYGVHKWVLEDWNIGASTSTLQLKDQDVNIGILEHWNIGRTIEMSILEHWCLYIYFYSLIERSRCEYGHINGVFFFLIYLFSFEIFPSHCLSMHNNAFNALEFIYLLV
jgi:hypothetical protein